MADNYLEKRMEDLRNGRLVSSSHSTVRPGIPPRKGYLSIQLPERRVLVTGGTCGIARTIALAFRRSGSKTAILDSDKEEGDRLAHDEGVRFYCSDNNDSDSIDKAMADLLNAWRDIDIIILDVADSDCGGDAAVQLVCNKIADWRRKLPFPNTFGGRVIILYRKEQVSVKNTMDSLKEYGFTVNSIVLNNEKSQYSDMIGRLCLFLAAPGNEFIDGITIPVN